VTARVKNGDELEFPPLLNQNPDNYAPKLARKGAKTAFHRSYKGLPRELSQLSDSHFIETHTTYHCNERMSQA
jgi:hypothetical protein